MNKQIGYCGLACCVCSENNTCAGCRDDGCKNKEWCKNYNCCREKKLNGCWECSAFPEKGGGFCCSGADAKQKNMLDKLRIRAFAKFAKENGEDELARCLLLNKENGVVYHYNGQLIGDYDAGKTEEEIIDIIKNGVKKQAVSAASHYDSLIDENNDPVYDPEPLREYMDKWDGQKFIDELQLSPEKSVLEIGVGTGRLAVRTAPLCGSFIGIDISPKTIERAKKNLAGYKNTQLICGDIMSHNFDGRFDVIYSSLTFMHIEDKSATIAKIAGLLRAGGRFVLSIDKNQAQYIDVKTRKVKIYPDKPDEICGYIKAARLALEKRFETEFAYVFAAVRPYL